MKKFLIIIVVFQSALIIVLLFNTFKPANNNHFIIKKTTDGFESFIKIEDVNYKFHFYSNGKLKKISEIENDIVKGVQMSFFENGRLFFYTAIDNEKKPIGDQIFFFSNGRLQTIEKKSHIPNLPYVFEKVSFNSAGSIEVDSSYFFIFNAYSKFEGNQAKYYLRIQLVSGSKLDERFLQYGSYDEQWKIIDSSKLWTVEMNRNECEIELNQLQNGENIVRGEVVEITAKGDTFNTPFSHTIIFTK